MSHAHDAAHPHDEAHAFDGAYWEAHWVEAAPDGAAPPNPHLAELVGLAPGTALEAGCGEGGEAIALAELGWRVTAADVSAEALARARRRPGADAVEWRQADLGSWAPAEPFDLVTTFYAHPAMPQLDFYARIAGWVAPGGTLLIVGHQHDHGHPEQASASAEAVVARLDADEWTVAAAFERPRRAVAPGGREIELHDVVVRAVRSPGTVV